LRIFKVMVISFNIRGIRNKLCEGWFLTATYGIWLRS
jgi:hypothetical protein